MIIEQDLEQYFISQYSILPRSYQLSSQQQDRCYLGVSLETEPYQKRAMLEAMLDWISRHFADCAVLVGDSLHRLTLQITYGLSPEEASKAAIKMGEEFINDNLPLFKERLNERYKILKCSVLQKKQEYTLYEGHLKSSFDKDVQFRNLIERSAASYVDRRLKDKDRSAVSISAAEMMQLSRQYLIEEMAIFAVVANMGWTVDVYPGKELPILAEILKENYSDVPEPLKKRKNIALKLKPIPKVARTYAAASA